MKSCLLILIGFTLFFGAFLMCIFFVITDSPSIRKIKTIEWKSCTVQLEEINAGATVAFSYEVTILKKGIFGVSKYKIFQVYGSPTLQNIEIKNDILRITVFNPTWNKSEVGLENKIEINLKYIDEFIDNPVMYKFNILKKRNKSYSEPDFLFRAGQAEKMAEKSRESMLKL